MVSVQFYAIILILFAISTAQAGWIEATDGKTIIHVKVFFVPHPSDTRPYWRAEYAGVKRFRQRFPKIFAQRYQKMYKANPDKYGRYNWDRVEIQLHRATGIQVEGVETDLM